MCVDLDELQSRLERLVRMAIEASTSLDELVDSARAASALGTRSLLELVAEHIAAGVDDALASSSAWEAELTYSKLDAWAQTGHKARMLSEAFGLVAPGLRQVAVTAPAAVTST